MKAWGPKLTGGLKVLAILAAGLGIAWLAVVDAEEPVESRPYQIRMWVASDGMLPEATGAPSAVVSTPTPALPLLRVFPAPVERWKNLVYDIFGPRLTERVLALIECESGGDPNATGSAGERGLLQIHPIHFDSTYDPRGNLLAAYRISNGGRDWSAWSCAR